MALREYLAAFANLLYPMHCFGCQKSLHDGESQYLCKGCWDGIGYIAGPRCPRCGTGLGVYAAAPTKGCMECRSQNFRFDSAFCVTYYEGVVKELIHQFKYGRQEFLAKPLTDLLVQYAKEINLHSNKIDMVVAVPLHGRKKAERGFNQAELLGRNLGRSLGIDICIGGLRRIRNTTSQTRQPYYRRAENVRGAFSVKNPSKFREKNVLLVDDVLTSGLTASECARVIKEAGAGKVYVLTIAKSRGIMADA